jgi:hypothetical protein
MAYRDANPRIFDVRAGRPGRGAVIASALALLFLALLAVAQDDRIRLVCAGGECTLLERRWLVAESARGVRLDRAARIAQEEGWPELRPEAFDASSGGARTAFVFGFVAAVGALLALAFAYRPRAKVAVHETLRLVEITALGKRRVVPFERIAAVDVAGRDHEGTTLSLRLDDGEEVRVLTTPVRGDFALAEAAAGIEALVLEPQLPQRAPFASETQRLKLTALQG